MVKQDALDCLVNIESVALSYYAHVPNIRGVKRLQDDVDKLRGYINQIITEEECKRRRCLRAAAMMLRDDGYTPSEYDKEHVENWYAKQYEGKDD